MKNVVLPYMIMRSPGCETPTLSPSASASIVPTATGMPAGNPVAAAASAVTTPATSAGQPIAGSRSIEVMPSAYRSDQPMVARSNSGLKCDAVWASMTIAPVRRCTR